MNQYTITTNNLFLADCQPTVLGQVAQPGKRSDLADACDVLRATKSLKQVADQMPCTYVRYHRGFQSLHGQLYDTPRDQQTDPFVLVLWGPSGTGKTKRAFELASKHQEATGLAFYVKNSSNHWWQDYSGQRVVIVDEFCGQSPIGELLKWIDRYPLAVEYKGGGCQLQAYKWIFTSNYHPDSWYCQGLAEHQAALRRRINRVVEVKDLNEEYELAL